MDRIARTRPGCYVEFLAYFYSYYVAYGNAAALPRMDRLYYTRHPELIYVADFEPMIVWKITWPEHSTNHTHLNPESTTLVMLTQLTPIYRTKRI